jgi:D-alanyl-D-alanine carboxypeptidase (penicillin-binding protein 5/6)
VIRAVVFLACAVKPALAFDPDENLTARAALLMDANSGRILYQKEADLRLPPASTTKVMTAIVTLESGHKLTESLTVSKDATRMPASKLYLRQGQTMSIEELLYAIMLASANDASVVLAEGIGGSVESFTEQMTKRAHELGATNSNFTNPHGLTAPDHYSTVRDLATVFRYAMRNALFREIVQTKFSSVSSTALVRKKLVPRRISVRNHNRLLWDYDGALGGKTGYTVAAQKCFVGAVQRNGVTLIVAILGARDQWGDTKRLLHYGFENYEALKTAPPPQGKSAWVEAPSGARAERLTKTVVLPQELRAKSSMDGFVLQLGSFRERERAELLAQQVRDKGFDTSIETVVLGGGEASYRVRVGPYAELNAAQEAAQEILTKSGHRAVVLPLAAGRQAS